MRNACKRYKKGGAFHPARPPPTMASHLCGHCRQPKATKRCSSVVLQCSTSKKRLVGAQEALRENKEGEVADRERCWFHPSPTRASSSSVGVELAHHQEKRTAGRATEPSPPSPESEAYTLDSKSTDG